MLLRTAGNDEADLMEEGTFYGMACSTLPPFATALTTGMAGDVATISLFSDACGATRVWRLPTACKPELHVGSRGGLTASPPARRYAPAFNGELKSAGDLRALMQAMTYTTMDMVRVFFPSPSRDTPAPPTYFSKPPVGYFLLAFPHVGYFMSIEWIGKLLVAPASQPFFLGSPEHAAAAAALPDVQYDEPFVLPPEVLAQSRGGWVTSAPVERNPLERIVWTSHEVGGHFYKVVRGHAFSAQFFRSMYAAYARLEQLATLPNRPGAIVWPTLRFGAHDVLVSMRFVNGKLATSAELYYDASSRVLARVAAAVAWLAAHQLIYHDWREQNVIVETGGETQGDAFLVDYDDCVVVDSPITCVDGYVTALRSIVEQQERDAAQRVAPTPMVASFAASLCRGGLGLVHRALDAAFVALATGPAPV